jgi:hypothetical protein
MPGNLILEIAKEYGQSPDDVESKWSLYWFNRAVLKLKAESINRQKDKKEPKR